MERSIESFMLSHSPKAEEAADALIDCLASKGLTYKEAVEALGIAKDKLGEKAVLLPDSDTDRQKLADSIAREIADGLAGVIY